jgi:hypothetical protein
VARFACGSGEWWDNNKGKNYRVGFRLKSDILPRSDRTLSAPGNCLLFFFKRSTNFGSLAAPITVDSQQKQKQITSAEVSLLPTIPPTSPISPVEPTDRILSATTNELTKLSLTNYAAPSQAAPAMKQNTQSPSDPTPVDPSQKSSKETTAAIQKSDFGSGEPKRVANIQTHIIAGQPATNVGLLGYENELDVPVSYKDGGPSNPDGSDPLYKAFVAGWCFAENPPPGIGDMPGKGS